MTCVKITNSVSDRIKLIPKLSTAFQFSLQNLDLSLSLRQAVIACLGFDRVKSWASKVDPFSEDIWAFRPNCESRDFLDSLLIW